MCRWRGQNCTAAACVPEATARVWRLSARVAARGDAHAERRRAAGRAAAAGHAQAAVAAHLAHVVLRGVGATKVRAESAPRVGAGVRPSLRRHAATAPYPCQWRWHHVCKRDVSAAHGSEHARRTTPRATRRGVAVGGWPTRGLPTSASVPLCTYAYCGHTRPEPRARIHTTPQRVEGGGGSARNLLCEARVDRGHTRSNAHGACAAYPHQTRHTTHGASGGDVMAVVWHGYDRDRCYRTAHRGLRDRCRAAPSARPIGAAQLVATPTHSAALAPTRSSVSSTSGDGVAQPSVARAHTPWYNGHSGTPRGPQPRVTTPT